VPACRICYPYEPSCNGNVAIGCGTFAAGFGIIGSGAIDRHLSVEPSTASSSHRSAKPAGGRRNLLWPWRRNHFRSRRDHHIGTRLRQVGASLGLRLFRRRGRPDTSGSGTGIGWSGRGFVGMMRSLPRHCENSGRSRSFRLEGPASGYSLPDAQPQGARWRPMGRAGCHFLRRPLSRRLSRYPCNRERRARRERRR